jgi:hypothetical protein
VKALKQRMTYPRTGFVAYRAPTPGRRAISALTALIIAGLFVALFPFLKTDRAELILMAGVVGVGFLLAGQRIGLPRFLVLGFLAPLAAVAISSLGAGRTVAHAAWFAALGLALGLSGALTLAAYLRRTRPAGEA